MNVFSVTLTFATKGDADWFAKCAEASVKTRTRLDACRAGIMQDSVAKAFVVERATRVVGEPQALKCESCGCIGGDVVETTCPYAADVDNNPNVPATLCGSCYQQRCDDI